ncbi:MAG: arylsulfatase [Planctomycetes bacterium]|nr:arylsulfatase [Planctomycetota bacterium]
MTVKRSVVGLVQLLALGLAWFPAAAFSQTESSPPRRPNIVFILADDLGYSDLGCYGGEIPTPHLDRLAANGLRFTQFYNTARCWPSRAALLTGFYPQQVRRDTVAGLPSGSQGVRPGWARLLPEMLKPLGYRSYHSGKWHVDGKPTQNGFDRSYDLTDQNRFFSPQSHLEDDRPLPAVKATDGYYATTAIADHALKCLQDHSQNFASRPFFHYVCFTAPHFPLQAPAADIARHLGKYDQGWESARERRWRRLQELGIIHCSLSALEREVGPPYPFPKAIENLGPGEIDRPLPWSELSEQQRQFQATKMAIHAAMVDRMDREIGRLLEQLKAMQALDNTVIFFASDNGASAEIMVRGDGHDPAAPAGSAATHLCLGPGFSSVANTPFRRHKTWVHEGGISTPLIVHWPAGIPARGDLRHNPGHLIDIVPTVLELVGGRRPETWEGQPVPTPPGTSLVPAFTRDGSVNRADLWWQHEGNRALRVGDWKIVAAGAKADWELYDLAADRAESRNLASSATDRARQLAEIWEKHLQEFTATAKQDLPAGK